jgi:hypothetical protein
MSRSEVPIRTICRRYLAVDLFTPEDIEEIERALFFGTNFLDMRKARSPKDLEETFTYTVQNFDTGLYQTTTQKLGDFLKHWDSNCYRTSDEIIAKWNRNNKYHGWFYFPCEFLNFRHLSW